MNINTTYRQATGKQILLIIVTGLMVALTACASEKAGLDKLRELCEKDAGLTINKTVEADGYYDATRQGGALWVLIPSEYNFTEFCDFDTNKPSFGVPGCWRLTKVSRETNQCNTQIDSALSRNGSDASRAFREKNCIAVEKIDKPMARYSYHSDSKAWFDKNDRSEFRRSDSFIKDTLNSQVIGRYISYSYNVRPPHSSPKSCHVVSAKYISFREAKLIDSVIKQSNKKY